MEANINKTDSAVRFFIGIGALVLSQMDFFNDYLVLNLLLVFGIYLIVTSLIRVCPIYLFLNINTNQNSKKKMRMY